MGRPRLDLPEHHVAQAYAEGDTIAGLAAAYDVDRSVIRRIITEHTTDETARVIPLHATTSHPGHPPDGYITSTQLVTITGLTYRQIDFWTRTGRLQPVNNPTPGSGILRVYPRSEAPVAALMRRLLDAGLNLATAHDMARELLATGTTTLAGIRIHLPQSP